jgi:hypothetical protein
MAHDVRAAHDVGDDAQAAGGDAHAPERFRVAAYGRGPCLDETRALIRDDA